MSRTRSRDTVRCVIGHSTNAHGVAAAYWILVIAILVTDQVTKTIAVVLLAPGVPVDLPGGAVRFLLVFNEQGPWGLSAGRHARPVLVLLTGASLLVLWAGTRRARWLSHTGAAALGVITGGVAGNLVDRLWSSRGVVDFIDVGVGTLNVADLGIGVGVCLLVVEMG